MVRLFLPFLLLLAACNGQVTFPGCFPFCGGGGGPLPPLPPPEVRSLEVVLLREVVEVAPGGLGPSVVPLPLWVRIEGNPGTYRVYLNAEAESPRGTLRIGLEEIEVRIDMRGGEGQEVQLRLWVDGAWTPGDYQAYLLVGASNYSGEPVRRPFTLRVR
ncbi:MAG: hypothetical protein RMI80_11355 [Meiothermus sp.]|uniref:hypothetical protein n=1 Tax=Meiothermus sp. TaxID=1955249 RepID=UPI00298EF6BC|nr:hypothetical protein [Meiothermus sp.]MDW8091997.1 hypothetical protein [Meiothermus sp.]